MKGKTKMSNLPKASVFCMYIRNICLAFLSMFFMIYSQSFATGIPATDGEAQPADCDSDTLDTTSGTANLRADFEANRIDLRWYDNNTMLNVSSTSSDKCTYDTTIDLPTNPTKTGYTFKGWKVRPEYDFTTLPVNQFGTTGYGKSTETSCLHGTTADYTSGSTVCVMDGFNDLNIQEWKTVFPWGTIYGMSKCSSTPGTTKGEHGTPNDTYDKYCWCRATGYIPNGQSTKYSPLKPTNWTFNSDCNVIYNGRTVNICSTYCAGRCATHLTEFSSFINGILR